MVVVPLSVAAQGEHPRAQDSSTLFQRYGRLARRRTGGALYHVSRLIDPDTQLT